MNRSIALFVALTVLLAHSLAIRTDASGNLAPPYDQAFVAYRIASHWVYSGSFDWNVGQSGIESYPSVLWVMICAVGERLYVSINSYVRVVGLLATACSFILSSRFHSDRAASLITPMLLAISGTMAAAAVSGTEVALLTMLLTFSFLAFERGWHRTTAVLLLLSGLTRSEAWVLVPVFLFLRYRACRREKRGIEGPPAAPLLTFALPILGALGLAAIRWRITGQATPTWILDLSQLDGARLANGLAYLRDFFVTAASPALLLYSLWYAFRRQLSHTGAHALAVFFAWAGVIVLQGGGLTPFAESMVPVLPIALLSAQEAMINALNSRRKAWRILAWTSFVGAVIASSQASLPMIEDGGSGLAALQRAWNAPAAEPRYGFEGRLGRAGLDEELEATRTLRSVGIFLRDNADPSHSVLTPWPGSIGYLSHLEVHDLLGMVTPAAPYTRPRSRAQLKRVDILAALDASPDYIVPQWRTDSESTSVERITADWLLNLDDHTGEQGREKALRAAFQRYELITIPLPSTSGTGLTKARLPLLRLKSLGLTPRIEVSYEAGHLSVRLTHAGHQQLADLVIHGLTADGHTLCITPTGQISTNDKVRARTNLLIAQTGERAVTLFDMQLEARVIGLGQLKVSLLNPGTDIDSAGSRVSGEIVVELGG